MWMPVLWNWYDVAGAEGWTVEGGTLRRQTCSGIPIAGGPGQLGAEAVVSKVVQGLPPHYKLKIQYQFWKVDSWDNEIAYLYVDRREQWRQVFSWSEGVELCYGGGAGSPEKIVNVNREVFHTMDAVLLEFKTTLDEGADNESWGLRQFYLWVHNTMNTLLPLTSTRNVPTTVPPVPGPAWLSAPPAPLRTCSGRAPASMTPPGARVPVSSTRTASTPPRGGPSPTSSGTAPTDPFRSARRTSCSEDSRSSELYASTQLIVVLD